MLVFSSWTKRQQHQREGRNSASRDAKEDAIQFALHRDLRCSFASFALAAVLECPPYRSGDRGAVRQGGILQGRAVGDGYRGRAHTLDRGFQSTEGPCILRNQRGDFGGSRAGGRRLVDDDEAARLPNR